MTRLATVILLWYTTQYTILAREAVVGRGWRGGGEEMRIWCALLIDHWWTPDREHLVDCKKMSELFRISCVNE